MFTRDSLSQVLMFKDFPKELVQGVYNGMGFQGSGYAFCQKWLLLFIMHLRFLLTNDYFKLVNW